MDLVESVLRSADAEAYIEAFKKSNIEAATLSLLTDNDLQIIGIDNADVRKAILEKTSKLLIPSEKKIDLAVTKDYAELVLSQIAHQLHLHHANLSCALTRKDLIVCDIKLHKASQCLLNCITSLENQLDEFENKYGGPKKKNYKEGRKIVVVGASAVALLIIGKLIRDYVLKS